MSDDDLDLDEPTPPRQQPPAEPAGDVDEYTSPVVNWRELDPADAGPIWEELDEWVRWARYRYDLRMLQPCWFKHPIVVEQLSALHTAWTVLFDQEDSGLGPVTFLERVHGAHEVLRPAMQGCTLREHRYVALQDWPAACTSSEWGTLINGPWPPAT
ncbi:MAG TPA: hypothetical protein VF277_02495 [Steroidobacteraceae bacterium]